jgi:hypothetical protein
MDASGTRRIASWNSRRRVLRVVDVVTTNPPCLLEGNYVREKKEPVWRAEAVSETGCAVFKRSGLER